MSLSNTSTKISLLFAVWLYRREIGLFAEEDGLDVADLPPAMRDIMPPCEETAVVVTFGTAAPGNKSIDQ